MPFARLLARPLLRLRRGWRDVQCGGSWGRPFLTVHACHLGLSSHGVPLTPTSATREELIDKNTESAVSRMQSVIELGRVIRDRKTIPIKV